MGGLPLLADGAGPFVSPTSDSEHFMIRLDTARVAVVVIAACRGEQLPAQLDRLGELLARYSAATDLTVDVSRGKTEWARSGRIRQSAGQRLVEPARYPPAISRHLTAEGELLTRPLAGGRYTVAVEVGCMHVCLHATAIIGAGVRYLGVDIVPESIRVFQEPLHAAGLPPGHAQSRVLDVANLSAVGPNLAGHCVLVVFSFDSFGNPWRPVAALREIAAGGYDALVLTYGTLVLTYGADEASSAVRADYHNRCGHGQVRQVESNRDVCFLATEGLCTWAYRRRWFTGELRAAGFNGGCYAIEGIGLGCRRASTSVTRMTASDRAVCWD